MSSLPDHYAGAALIRRPSLDEIIRRLKRYKPKNIYDLLCECRLPMRLLDWGCYRNCWEIIGTGLVIKLVGGEADEGRDKSLTHTRIEIAAYERIKEDRQFVRIRHLLPAIHYYNRKAGLVLMSKYKPCTKRWAKKNLKLMTNYQQWFLKKFPQVDLEPLIKYANYGLGKDGNLVILDLGCFSNRNHHF